MELRPSLRLPIDVLPGRLAQPEHYFRKEPKASSYNHETSLRSLSHRKRTGP
jgi:hypothetical protein